MKLHDQFNYYLKKYYYFHKITLYISKIFTYEFFPLYKYQRIYLFNNNTS